MTIPDSVTSIGDYAFVCCLALESLNIPQSINLGEWVFSHCSSLVSIVISNSDTSNCLEAFEYCLRRMAVFVPEGLEFPQNAFRGCAKIKR